MPIPLRQEFCYLPHEEADPRALAPYLFFNMSERVKSYKDLVVWRKSIILVKLVYQLTRAFPADEKFGLVSQMRRAAVSVPSNLAEGHARNTTGEFIQFISHAEGSLAELETQLILAVELNFCSSTDAQPSHNLVQEVQKMANALRRSLASRP
jgi:four helix bundle protein